MALNNRKLAPIAETQQRAFRLAERDHGLYAKAIAMDSETPYQSLLTYANGKHQMPLEVFRRMLGVIPVDILNLFFEGTGFHLAEDREIEDMEKLAEACQNFLQRKNECHHPNSEAGPGIGPNEHSKLEAAANAIEVKS